MTLTTMLPALPATPTPRLLLHPHPHRRAHLALKHSHDTYMAAAIDAMATADVTGLPRPSSSAALRDSSTSTAAVT